MIDSKVGPTGGKLTQLLDMQQVQNINKLLQLTVHSSVCFTHFTPQYFQQFFCLLQTNVLYNLSTQLLYLLMTKQPTKWQIMIFVKLL